MKGGKCLHHPYEGDPRRLSVIGGEEEIVDLELLLSPLMSCDGECGEDGGEDGGDDDAASDGDSFASIHIS